MKQNSDSRTARVVPPTKGTRPWLRLASALMALGAGAFAYLHFANDNHSPPTPPDTIAAETKLYESPVRRRSSTPEGEVRAAPTMSHARPMDAASASERPDPNKVRQWVSSLITLDLKSGSINAEQAATWKENLRQLIDAGTQAVPAI